jgi:hypothetical protein
MIDCLKAKTKEEILRDARASSSLQEFYKFAEKYKELYNEELSFDDYPLAVKIFKQSSAAQSNFPYDAFTLKIKSTQLIVSKAEDDKALIQMFPARKIKSIEHTRYGNLFIITSIEQFWEIVKFLKTH